MADDLYCQLPCEAPWKAFCDGQDGGNVRVVRVAEDGTVSPGRPATILCPTHNNSPPLAVFESIRSRGDSNKKLGTMVPELVPGYGLRFVFDPIDAADMPALVSPPDEKVEEREDVDDG